MNKKYIIALVVVLVACSAFFFYIRNKNEKEANKHLSQEYSRRIKVAKKSPSAGLRHMGQALNQYRDDKGVYPPSLAELYPDYIPVKDFIDNIEWHYVPKVGDFILQKTIEGPGKKVLTASIGSDLQPASTSDKMLASDAKPKSSPVKPDAEPSTEKPEERMTVASTTMSSPIANPVVPEQKTEPHQTVDASQNLQDNLESSKPEAESFKTHQVSEKRRFIKRLKGGFLVWKNEDGSLGFGNIQYPLNEDLTIFDGGEWVEMSRRKPRLASTDDPL